MESVLLDIVEGHCRSLTDGKVVHLKPEMICAETGIGVKLDKKKASRLMKAKRLGKGARLMMSKEEVEATGGMMKMKGKGKKMKHMSIPRSTVPARTPLIDVGSLEVGRHLIKGSGMMVPGGMMNGPAPFISQQAPAMNPLIQYGTLQHGSDFIKSG